MTAIPSVSCDYCGLPVATAAAPMPGERVYCCFGCRFASQVTEEGAGPLRGTLPGPFARLGLSVFCTVNVVMLTMALWSYADNPETPFAIALADFLRYFALLFTLPVVWLLGRPLAASAMEQLRRGFLSTDLLLLSGVVAAVVVSAISTFLGKGHVYFEVACVILVLVAGGRWLEAAGRLKASRALDDLEDLLPRWVLRLRGEVVEEIPIDEIRGGDLLRVRAGERLPVDGTIESGRASVDEQFLTGESEPVLRIEGEEVFGGTLNLDGDLVLRAKSVAAEGALARLIRHVRRARLARGRHQALADRWSQAFFPIIGLVALGTLLVHARLDGWGTGLMNALSVVLIACPCALALATPLAVWASLGTAARRGVLFRSGEAIERLAETDTLFFDKTGTLTTGQPRVMRFVCEDPVELEAAKARALALTRTSTHPFSVAIQDFLEVAIPVPRLSRVRAVAGAGIEAKLADDSLVYAGSRARGESLEFRCGPTIRAALESQGASGASHVFVGCRPPRTAMPFFESLFLLEETIRPSARPAIAELRSLGIRMEVLTGDRIERGRVLGLELGLPVRAGLLPDQKLHRLQSTPRPGRRAGRGGAEPRSERAAMVGDGVNDAPALAGASLGIALGCGAEISRDAADVCLVQDDLTAIPWAIAHARRTVRTIRQNLAWSFAYNGLGVVAAAFGWLHPAIAAALMVASSLMVLANSLRLQQSGPVAADPPNPSPPVESPAVAVEVKP